MRVVLRTAPLLLIGIVAIGCEKERSGNSGGQPQGKVDPNLPAVTLNVPGMT